jgi:hypothetical protein
VDERRYDAARCERRLPTTSVAVVVDIVPFCKPSHVTESSLDIFHLLLSLFFLFSSFRFFPFSLFRS